MTIIMDNEVENAVTEWILCSKELFGDIKILISHQINNQNEHQKFSRPTIILISYFLEVWLKTAILKRSSLSKLKDSDAVHIDQKLFKKAGLEELYNASEWNQVTVDLLKNSAFWGKYPEPKEPHKSELIVTPTENGPIVYPDQTCPFIDPLHMKELLEFCCEILRQVEQKLLDKEGTKLPPDIQEGTSKIIQDQIKDLNQLNAAIH